MKPHSHTHFSSPSSAAVKIQSTYRSHKTRTQVRKISSVHSSSVRLQGLIQRQETVDAIRRDERERVRISEALMVLLLTLDGVQTVDPVVRELRRRLSRRIVGMQEVVDAVVAAHDEGENNILNGWDDGFWWVWEMEEEVCRRKGGDEMERFCADHLGFRCLQRFLHDH